MEQHVVDYDELKLLSRSQLRELIDLTKTCNEKNEIIAALEVVKVELENESKESIVRKKLLDKMKEKHEVISVQMEDALERVRNKDDKIKELHSINEKLEDEVNVLGAELSLTKQEVESNLSEISR